MAETTEKAKKAKAPAKPKATSVAKKAPAKKKTAPEQALVATPKQAVVAPPTHQEIALLARQYWIDRGHHDGQAEQDWLRAEQELLKLAS